MRHVLLLAGSLFAALAAYYLMKPVRDALLIHRAGLVSLPYALVLQAVAALLAVFVLNLVAARMRRRQFVFGTTASFVVVTAALLGSMQLEEGPAAAAVAVVFYVWTTVYVVTALSIIWSLAASQHTADAGRRRYLIIALAAPAGAVAGAWISGRVVPTLGLSASMALAVVILLAVCGMATVLAPPHEEALDRSQSPWAAGARGMLDILGDPMLARIALLVVFGSCAWAVLDRQVYFIVGGRELGEQGTAEFFGHAYAVINWATLGAQVMMLWWVRRGFDPLYGIVVLPVLCLVGAGIGAAELHPDAWILLWGAHGALAYSINFTSREMLYLSLPDDHKYRAKAVIDVLVLRMSEGLGGVLLYVMYTTGKDWAMGPLLGGLGLAWLGVTRSTKRLSLAARADSPGGTP